MRVVAGIDPSTTATGIVLLKGEGREVLHAGEIAIPGKASVAKSLKISGEVLSILQDFTPDLVVVEGYGFASAKIAPLVEVGALIRAFILMGTTAPYVEAPPSTLKKFITGSGKAEKGMVMLEVFKRFGFSPATNNIADAYSLAVLGLHYLGIPTGLPQNHTSSLKPLQVTKHDAAISAESERLFGKGPQNWKV
jgi:Holliday junction resolvasome RuvABC endonuclease subunit